MNKRQAKIVATLGPSSNEIKVIETLIDAGVDVARVNMSHGDHKGHTELIGKIRQAAKNKNREIAILMDLQGPKIRVSKLETPLSLKKGETWLLGHEDFIEGEQFIPTTYRDLVSDAHEGAMILFDDGLLEAKVVEKHEHFLKIEVVVGGDLKSNKGINLPDVNVSAPSLTEKDERDLIFGLRQHVDYVALSFVRRAEDILEVKYKLHALKVDLPIIAKIEKPEAIEHIDEIIAVTDVIMIARGDMGVEVGNHLVPAIQKMIITKCNERGVPVITATQMLDSMIQNARPTRAEASDVANAVWDGTDAVMLSGESASGEYPVESVQMMDQIVREAEKAPKVRPFLRDMDLSDVTSSNQVAASLIAEKTRAKWILSMTEKGRSCLKMTRFRPKTEVLGVTNQLTTLRRMSLYWGVTPFFIDSNEEDIYQLELKALDKLKADHDIRNGDKIVITHGDGQYFKQGTSNSVRVEIVKDMVSKKKSEDDLVQAVVDQGTILLDTKLCASCQSCVHICPYGIWQIDEADTRETTINHAQVDKCTMDLACVESCPTGAIEIMPNKR
jgi:pyruvate kinase